MHLGIPRLQAARWVEPWILQNPPAPRPFGNITGDIGTAEPGIVPRSVQVWLVHVGTAARARLLLVLAGPVCTTVEAPLVATSTNCEGRGKREKNISTETGQRGTERLARFKTPSSRHACGPTTLTRVFAALGELHDPPTVRAPLPSVGGHQQHQLPVQRGARVALVHPLFAPRAGAPHALSLRAPRDVAGNVGRADPPATANVGAVGALRGGELRLAAAEDLELPIWNASEVRGDVGPANGPAVTARGEAVLVVARHFDHRSQACEAEAAVFAAQEEELGWPTLRFAKVEVALAEVVALVRIGFHCGLVVLYWVLALVVR